MKRLCEGRVAIVTGAGRGIGREHALMLAAHGAKVVVNDLGSSSTGEGGELGPAEQVVEEIRAAGGEAIVNGADVSDFEQAGEMIRQAIDTWGTLDVLVNNAGILRDRMIFNMSEADWDSVIKVHLKGTFCPTRHAVAWWREQSKAGKKVDARLINTTSASGLYGNPGQCNYGAAKAGIASMSTTASRELSRYGVTVNCVAPAALTRLTEGLHEEITEGLREGHGAHWIAPIVTWLASTESGNVTGRVFEAMGTMLAVAEGWHRGPVGEQTKDPTKLGPLVNQLVEAARPDCDVDGNEFGKGAA